MHLCIRNGQNDHSRGEGNQDSMGQRVAGAELGCSKGSAAQNCKTAKAANSYRPGGLEPEMGTGMLHLVIHTVVHRSLWHHCTFTHSCIYNRRFKSTSCQARHESNQIMKQLEVLNYNAAHQKREAETESQKRLLTSLPPPPPPPRDSYRPPQPKKKPKTECKPQQPNLQTIPENRLLLPKPPCMSPPNNPHATPQTKRTLSEAAMMASIKALEKMRNTSKDFWHHRVTKKPEQKCSVHRWH